MAKRSRAPVLKPALWIAAGGLAAGACFMVYRAFRRRGQGIEDLLPRVDVSAYNDALMAP
jgi:mitochondrial fission protein ELM1